MYGGYVTKERLDGQCGVTSFNPTPWSRFLVASLGVVGENIWHKLASMWKISNLCNNSH